MYNRIKTLHALGQKITLHYFSYNKNRNVKDLEPFCTAVFPYKRKGLLSWFPFSKPYIIATRIDRKLIERLNNDRSPILLEGIHCTGIIPHLAYKDRIVIRMHNDEAEYYQKLITSEKKLLRKLYFVVESFLLKKYQHRLSPDLKIICVSRSDIKVFENQYHYQRLFYIPSFLSWQEVTSKTGKGNYCMYHGNMSIAENEAAAIWLIDHVFSTLRVPFIIAGKNISDKLMQAAARYKHIRLVSNPDFSLMDKLIQDAQIHILPSLNNTGLKLKLLHALFQGRFCITNNEGVKGTDMEDLVYVVSNRGTEYIKLIEYLFQKSFSSEEKNKRNQLLNHYNNIENGRRLIELYSHYQ